MKSWIFLAGLFLASCQYFETKSENSKGPEATSERQYEAPDVSITAANAYSDLFLDSAAVNRYIQTKGLDAAAAQQLRNFYNSRNFQYAWLASDGFTEQGRGLWNLYNESDSAGGSGKKGEKAFRQRVDSLISTDSLQVTASDSLMVQTEIGLTHQFLQVKNNATALQVPAKKGSVMEVADSVLQGKQSGVPEQYNQLKQQLKKYYDLAKNGGWQPVTAGPLRKGASSPSVTQLKKRLMATGELQGSDTSAVYDNNLDSAIKTFQAHHGVKQDGRITDTLIAIMNVPVEKRMAQILVNMNRMLWAPQQASHFIEVNIPSFMLHVYENNSKAFDMPVVVGKEGTNTMMFTGDLNQIVFSPYWNIPASIVKEELLPAMKNNPGYLKSRNMEIVKQGDSLPVIRQLPGPDNSLGKVKFLFPNSFDIYFHDTPAKGLFNREKRAFSHGCIRLADAEKMAAYLLRDNPEWTPEKITQAMNSRKEQYVKLKDPVPVRINYYTAWVDEQGQLQFRDDVYGNDEKVYRKMFL